MIHYLRFLPLILLFVACGDDANDETNEAAHAKEVDLMSYNLPLKVYAPEGYTVEAQNDILDDVLLKGPDYHVQIYGMTATQSREERKKEELQKVKNSEEFVRLVEEEPYGFIYETKLANEEKAHLNFFYVLNKGDKTYTFQSTTRFDEFSEDAIRKMYASVKQE